MSNLSLSPEQLAFMLENHEAIERGIIEAKKGNSQALNTIAESDTFYTLFGDIHWDDALDRYESSSAYDNTLRINLHAQLQADIATGKAKLPLSSPKMQADEDVDDDKIDLVVLKQLPGKK